jgi:sialate O-acetylesterase
MQYTSSRLPGLMLKSTLTCLVACFAVCFSLKAIAKPVLPYFFSDHMVLQQNSTPALWGTAKKGSKLVVDCSWNKKKYLTRADQKGNWKLQVETPAAGGPYEIRITDETSLVLRDIYIGEVWLCSGQSNMEMQLKGFKDQPILHSNDDILFSANPAIRLFTVPRAASATELDTIKQAKWNVAGPESVAEFSATAYYFGKYLYEVLRVPVGIVNISYGGSPIEAFMDAHTLRQFPEVKIPELNEPKPTNRMATTLYNGMLKPFMGYGIKGCIWYQGETNYSRADKYESLFIAFVESLRGKINQGNIPFYYAQIAPYNYGVYANATTPLYNTSFLREAQGNAQDKIPNSAMAVLLDVGEENSIHPSNKVSGGKRLAYLALAKTYGVKGFSAESPQFDSIAVSGNTLTVKFKRAPLGISSFGKPLTLFEIAGADKVFYPAKANIKAGQVIVSAPEVAVPVAVRYAFKNFVVGELFGTNGLPVSSFRSDNW